MTKEEAIDSAKDALHSHQDQSPCSRCRYGGKHLDAPPCTTCPAHPKVELENNPLTLDELRKMNGEPVYLSFLNDGDGHWDVIAYSNSEFLKTCLSGFLILDEYGKSWIAYRNNYLGTARENARRESCPHVQPNRAELISNMSIHEMAERLIPILEELCEDGIPAPDYMRNWLAGVPEEGEELW